MTLRHLATFRPTLLLLVLPAPVGFAQAPLDEAGYPTGQAPSDNTALPEGIEATGDTAEVRALTAWAEEHRRADPEQARWAVERTLVLARELNDQRGIGESFLILGDLASNLNQAETHYTNAYEAFEQIDDLQGLSRSRRNLGNVYRRRGDLEQALTYYFAALEGFKHLGDVKGQATALNPIGMIQQRQGNLEEAVTYYEHAATLAETVGDPILLTGILINLGGTFAELGSYESAEAALRRALVISEERHFREYMAAAANNLGYVLNKQGYYERALPYLFTTERLSKEVGSEGLLAGVYDELGKAYLGLGQYDRALHYANQSLALASERGAVSIQIDAYQTLSQTYKAAGNHEQALAHYEEYMAARDSIFTTEKAELITEMQTRYETEEKQHAIERLEQENRIQALQTSRWRIGMIAGVGGLLLLLGLLYYRYRLKQRANRLLEELDAAKSRFFANISHEFRTPLTVILGGLQDALAGRFDGSKSKLTEQHQAMLRNSRQLQRLIDEVLDLNRLEAGKLKLKPIPGDLVRSLQRIIEADAPLAERNGIGLTFEPNVESCPRLYDVEKLEKIVGNLLSNALKFTPKGGSVRVELHGGDSVEIAVSDTGPGISEEAQTKVFDRFAQVGDGSHHGGTGIGLALAKELAELQGGTITLESKPGEGSSFIARLPLPACRLADLRQEEKGKTVFERVPSFFRGEGQGEGAPAEEFAVGGDGFSEQSAVVKDDEARADRTTVLIIEDNADVRAFVRRSLEEVYRVLEAADGETGLQHARSELPDLIVSDIMLPDIDGYEVARRLKAEPDTECIPVVMLTARAAEEDQTEGYGSGAEVYITKPFSPKTLGAAVARLLEERQRLRRRLQENAQREAKRASGNGHPTLTDRARTVILEHLHDEDFGVEDLAAALGMSRPTLYRRVKKELGLTAADFVRILRLDHAHELLTSGAGSVSEVAYAVGFKSLSHFTRSFREHHGAAPSSIIGAAEK